MLRWQVNASDKRVYVITSTEENRLIVTVMMKQLPLYNKLTIYKKRNIYNV